MEQKYEPVRQAAVTLGVSIVVAAIFIGWSLPDAPRPQKYEAFVVDNKIVRLDTREGHIVACDFSRCVRILGNGKNVQPNSAPGLIDSRNTDRQPAPTSIPAAGASQPPNP
jgi:hypothetical protein